MLAILCLVRSRIFLPVVRPLRMSPNMTALWTLLACVGDGAIVGAVIGGALGYRQRQRRIKRAQEREWVRQRYTALLDQGVNASLSPPEQREIMQLSQRWCDAGLPQTPLGAPFPERQMS